MLIIRWYTSGTLYRSARSALPAGGMRMGGSEGCADVNLKSSFYIYRVAQKSVFLEIFSMYEQLAAL